MYHNQINIEARQKYGKLVEPVTIYFEESGKIEGLFSFLLL